MNNKKTYSFNVGILLRNPIRNFLNRIKFEGMDIEWLEEKEFLGSTFTVKALPEDLATIHNALRKYAEKLND